jgi:hypothetical protein
MENHISTQPSALKFDYQYLDQKILELNNKLYIDSSNYHFPNTILKIFNQMKNCFFIYYVAFYKENHLKNI